MLYEVITVHVIVFMAIVYIVLGMFLDPLGIILITLPILMPMFEAAHMDMVWVGVMVVKLIEIGLITPPVGLNLFVINGITPDVKLPTILKGALPFMLSYNFV